MNPWLIAAICVLSFVAVSFLIFLFLVKPGKRREQMNSFKSVKYAHRGLHGATRAENSLSAFRAAVEAGYGIELDVRLSADGELVVFHDDTLDRMTAETGRVDSRSFEELKKITLAGGNETIPSFEEVLRLVDGRTPLLVELKEDAGKYAVTEKAVAMLREYKGSYIVESFNPLALGRVKKLAPEILRGFLSQNFLSQEKYRSATYFLLQNMLLNVICRPDFIAYRDKDWKSAPLRLVKKLFKPATLAWTVKSKADEKAAYEHKFDGIIFEGYIPD